MTYERSDVVIVTPLSDGSVLVSRKFTGAAPAVRSVTIDGTASAVSDYRIREVSRILGHPWFTRELNAQLQAPLVPLTISGGISGNTVSIVWASGAGVAGSGQLSGLATWIHLRGK